MRRWPAFREFWRRSPLGWIGSSDEPFHYKLYRLPLVWAFLAMLLGVLWQRNSNWPGLALSGGAAAGCAVLTISLTARLPTLSSGLALLAIVLFGNFLSSSQVAPQSDSLSTSAKRESQPIAIRGYIRSAAVWKPNPNFRPQQADSHPWRTQWEIECYEIRNGFDWQPIRAFSRLSIEGRLSSLLPGDAVEVFGGYRKFMPPTNPGAFDLAEHFRQQAVFVSLSADDESQLRVLRRTWRFPLARVRAMAVRAVDQSLHRWIGFGQANLAAALVFGQREQVEWQDQQELMATGTLHLLAISGLHVEIVAGAVFLLGSILALRNRTLLWLVIAVCGSYAALAGGKPPVLRAVILVGALALARTVGRQTRLPNVLALAAIVLLLARTANIENVGVQLSFLAVASIGLFVADASPRAQRRSALQDLIESSLSRSLRWWRTGLRAVGTMANLSFWVWLLTCPLVWSHFHIVAPIAIPLNVLLALPMMISLLAGLLTALLGWIPPIGGATGSVCGGGLAFIQWLVQIGKNIPLGHFWLPAPPLWWSLVFYGVALGWLLVAGRRRQGYLGVSLCAWLLVALLPMLFGMRGYLGSNPMAGVSNAGTSDMLDAPSSSSASASTSGALPVPDLAVSHRPVGDLAELRCTFLDVGHGTSVIIEFPDGAVWLYDAGHLGAADRSHQQIAEALWELPTARIDRLLISHADADHYNAVLGLMQRFGVGGLVSTPQFWQSSDREVVQLIDALQQRKLPQAAWSAPSRGERAEVAWQILHPSQSISFESDNASSLCLMLEYAGKRILLPGDLEGSGLLNLVELPPRPCHVLMAPHHGSVTFDPEPILEWCRPSLVVVSGNHRATREEVLAKYSRPDLRLGITFRDGAVQVRINAAGNLRALHWAREGWTQWPAL